MPAASTLICRYTRTYARLVCVRARSCIEPQDFRGIYDEYIRPIHRHIGMCSISGGVPFRRRSVGFRYDTVDRTARIFDIGVLSRGKISAHRRMPEKYFDTVCRWLYVVLIYTQCCTRKLCVCVAKIFSTEFHHK